MDTTNILDFARAGAASAKPARPLFEIWKERQQARKQQEDQGVELLLPSGMPVKVKRVPLALMLRRGTLPDALTPIVNRFIGDINAEDAANKTEEELLAEMQEKVSADVDADPAQAYNDYLAIIDFVFRNAVVEPMFCTRADAAAGLPLPAGQDSYLFLDFGPNGEYPDVDYGDRLFVYQYCQGVDQTVEEFFRQQADALGVLPDLPGVSLPAEGTVRSDGPERELAGVSSGSSGMAVGIIHPQQDSGNEGSAAQAETTAAGHGNRAEVQPETDRQDAGDRPAKRPRKRRTTG